MLDATSIAALLRPFVDVPVALADQLRIYLDLLLRWNARINLTSVHDPEQIVTRHFGESLFAASVLSDKGAFKSSAAYPTLSDIGSGAGFPGIPIKLFAPEIGLTLIESQNKKATFLREVIRALDLTGAEVFGGRAESRNRKSSIVTLRAVENFQRTLPVAAGLVAPSGTLCLLVGKEQIPSAQAILASGWIFDNPVETPLSHQRVILVGSKA